MRKFLFVLGIISVVSFFAPSVEAGWVNGYFRSDGTYVSGHYRSDANGLRYDNYSYDGGDLYNPSYYDYSYGSSWRTPSYYTQPDYYTGYDYYNSYNDYYDYGY